MVENTEGSYKWYQASSAITLLELCCPEYVEHYGIRKGMEDVMAGYRDEADQASE